MTILTKSSVVKGQSSQFTLNKSALAALVPSAYYSDTANWKKVVIKYKSKEGNQSITVTFDATQENPVGTFLASERALDNFEIISIQIFDFDNGSFKLGRVSFTVEEFDVQLNSTLNFWDIANKSGIGEVEETSNNGIIKTSGSGAYNVNVLSNEEIVGDGYVEFTYSSIFSNVVFGVATELSLSGGFDKMITYVYNATGSYYEGAIPGGQSSQEGDIIRFERVGNTLYIKLNGVVKSSTTVTTDPIKASVSIYFNDNGVASTTLVK